MLKKLFFLLSFVFLANTSYVQANSIEHSSQEANFKLSTLLQWSEMQINPTKVDKNNGWLVNFSDQAGKKAPFALMILDGRNNEDFKQTNADFSNKNAEIILSQLIVEEKAQFEKEGYKISHYEVRDINNHSFIFIRLENNRDNTIMLRSMTFIDNYSYSLSCKISRNNSQVAAQLEENFNLILETLTTY